MLRTHDIPLKAEFRVIIACAPDSGYTNFAGVMLHSLLRNGDVGDSRVVIFSLGACKSRYSVG